MKRTTIIYADGTIKRGIFADGLQAREYAQQQARRASTIVRSQSIIAINTEIPKAVSK